MFRFRATPFRFWIRSRAQNSVRGTADNVTVGTLIFLKHPMSRKDTVMNATDVAAWSSVAMSLFSLASVFYFVGVKMATLQVKVDTMWEFTLRRGKSEAVRDGIAVMNSPIKATPEALEKMRPLDADLRAVYADVKEPTSEAELAVEIERRLGDKILHKVCIPNGMAMGACLFLAIEYLKRERMQAAT